MGPAGNAAPTSYGVAPAAHNGHVDRAFYTTAPGYDTMTGPGAPNGFVLTSKPEGEATDRGSPSHGIRKPHPAAARLTAGD